jgi:transcriptional regulator with XRE-family HTH domain
VGKPVLTPDDQAGIQTLAERVAALRAKAGLSLESFASIAGRSKDWVRDVEAGNTRDPGVFAIMRIADYFKISVPELVGRATTVSYLMPTPPEVPPTYEARLRLVEDTLLQLKTALGLDIQAQEDEAKPQLPKKRRPAQGKSSRA